MATPTSPTEIASSDPLHLHASTSAVLSSPQTDGLALPGLPQLLGCSLAACSPASAILYGADYPQGLPSRNWACQGAAAGSGMRTAQHSGLPEGPMWGGPRAFPHHAWGWAENRGRPPFLQTGGTQPDPGLRAVASDPGGQGELGLWVNSVGPGGPSPACDLLPGPAAPDGLCWGAKAEDHKSPHSPSRRQHGPAALLASFPGVLQIRT